MVKLEVANSCAQKADIYFARILILWIEACSFRI
jgi:hypothetical protein